MCMTMYAQGAFQMVAHIMHGIKRGERILEDYLYMTAVVFQVAPTLFRLPMKQNRAGSRLVETRQYTSHSGFAAAALSYQRQGASGIERQRSILNSMHHITRPNQFELAHWKVLAQVHPFQYGRCDPAVTERCEIYFPVLVVHSPLLLPGSATSLCFSAFNPRGFDSLRKRGLDISSMPKLTKVSAAPNMAMHKPGGRNHHHAPSRRAELLEAEKSILPQVAAVISPRPDTPGPSRPGSHRSPFQRTGPPQLMSGEAGSHRKECAMLTHQKHGPPLCNPGCA